MDQTEDALGHRWAQTQVRTLAQTGFPAVCTRCLLRFDSLQAERPCDHAFENIEGRL